MAYTVFVQPYLEGWEDGEEGATPITADILNDNYDAFLLALNTFIAGEVTPGLCSANPEETATGSLTKINIGGTVYSITGSGGSTVSFTQVLQNGTKIGTITIDGTAVDIYAPTPPTKTSDLTNDSNFVTDASYTHTDNNYTTSEKTKLSSLVEVEANPSGSASTNLTKIAINGTNYNVPTGSSSWTDVTGTLTAGSTSITLSDSSITTSSTVEPFTDVFGVNPTAMSVSTGSVTLTFEAQQSNLGVKVRVS